MKKAAFTRILALLLCSVLMLSLFAACGKEGASDQTGSKYDPTPVGSFVVAYGATVQITYDAQGLSQRVEGADEKGKNVVSQYTDNEQYGMACGELVIDLLQKAENFGYISMEYGNVVIKVIREATLSNENFLQDIVKDAQEFVKDIPVICVPAEDQDEKGYITADAARILLQQTLGLNSPETVRIVGEMTDQQYTFAAIVGGKQNTYSVHAVTGQVAGIIVQEPDLVDKFFGQPDTNEDYIPDMTPETLEGTQEEG